MLRAAFLPKMGRGAGRVPAWVGGALGPCALAILSVFFSVVSWIGTSAARAADAAPAATAVDEKAGEKAGIDFFENRIRPILVERCYECHSAESGVAKANLWLDSRAGILKGGTSGPALVPGNPDGSLIIQAIRRTDDEAEMPPKAGLWLSPAQVADFENWVRMGAPDPRKGGPAPPVEPPIDFEKAREFWSFSPIESPTPPFARVADPAWKQNPVDAFVAAGLREKRLRPARLADRATLIRRATYDLIGLPPTPAEIDGFVADPSPRAFEKLVERLLASPRYGERWGRHWLDVARYADTAGDNADFPVPQAYRYRNYVIDAFNNDKPYDQFIREQVAGDLLPSTSEKQRREQVVATGYIAISRRFQDDIAHYVHLTIDDTIDTLGKSILGLSLGCARCHNHKYDPIAVEDYYALYGVFASTKYPYPGCEVKTYQEGFVPLIAKPEAEELSKPYLEKRAAMEAENKAIGKEQRALRGKARELKKKLGAEEPVPGECDAKNLAALEDGKGDGKGNGKTGAVATVATTKKPTEKTDSRRFDRKFDKAKHERELRIARCKDFATLADLKAKGKALADDLKQRGKRLVAFTVEGRPKMDTAYAVEDGKGTNAHVFLKGMPDKIGPEVPRGFLRVLHGKAVPENDDGSGRLLLAKSLTDGNNPLTARVMVNRIWQHHFGRGIVPTPNDFGNRGEAPSNRALLDYLATRFRDGGWSIKAMHRLMMLSRAYQSSSEDIAANNAIDPDNQYVWHFGRRRIDAEEIRDAMLAVSGELDLTVGGPHPFPDEVTWRFSGSTVFGDLYPTRQRSVYLVTNRQVKQPFINVFDGADNNLSTGARLQTTTPLQALALMNDDFVREQAERLATRLLFSQTDDAKRIDLAFRLAYGRRATAEERARSEAYIHKYAQALATGGQAGQAEIVRAKTAWSSYARTLLASNEFMYVD